LFGHGVLHGVLPQLLISVELQEHPVCLLKPIDFPTRIPFSSRGVLFLVSDPLIYQRCPSGCAWFSDDVMSGSGKPIENLILANEELSFTLVVCGGLCRKIR
jgi:hypothetical protein